jgi:hypothetical protein
MNDQRFELLTQVREELKLQAELQRLHRLTRKTVHRRPDHDRLVEAREAVLSQLPTNRYGYRQQGERWITELLWAHHWLRGHTAPCHGGEPQLTYSFYLRFGVTAADFAEESALDPAA